MNDVQDDRTVHLTTAGIHQNAHAAVSAVSALLGLRPHTFTHGTTQHRWCVGVVARGTFELFDYDAGLLSVLISFNATYGSVMLYVGTIDDGGWSALSKGGLSQEKGEAMIVRIYEKLRGYKALPSEDALLEIIQPLGVWFSDRD